jgi:mono/diheme cytochrome c family protein
LTKHETIIARVAELGCAACHRRDGTGGPEPARAAFFTGTGEDLGDEGRFPPSLDHVGYKLIQPALADTIAHGTRLRPYLKTRMPAFGVPTAAPLAESLESCDVPENLPVLNQKGRNEAGRKLLGSSGLSCIACHAINGHKSLGISAMDLTRTIGRLRPEWLVDFLKNPADFTPGTRMPSFWSNVKREKMWGEVDAIRVYLLESDQSRLPEGMNSTQSYELIPSQRPIIFRSFITGAGTQAIGVGFPEGLNIAFDAEASNWALAWKGRFLDAEGTWFDRMNPPAVPMGTEVLTFGGGPPLARLKNDREPWPDTPRGYGNVRYLGYHLDARGYPTFRYRVDGTEVTDRIEPSHDGRTLNRELTWPAGKGVLFARIASAPSVIATEPGRCRVADRWNLTLLTPGPERLQIRNSPDGKSKEAILAVSSETELNRIRYRIQW